MATFNEETDLHSTYTAMQIDDTYPPSDLTPLTEATEGFDMAGAVENGWGMDQPTAVIEWWMGGGAPPDDALVLAALKLAQPSHPDEPFDTGYYCPQSQSYASDHPALPYPSQFLPEIPAQGEPTGLANWNGSFTSTAPVEVSTVSPATPVDTTDCSSDSSGSRSATPEPSTFGESTPMTTDCESE